MRHCLTLLPWQTRYWRVVINLIWNMTDHEGCAGWLWLYSHWAVCGKIGPAVLCWKNDSSSQNNFVHVSRRYWLTPKVLKIRLPSHLRWCCRAKGRPPVASLCLDICEDNIFLWNAGGVHSHWLGPSVSAARRRWCHVMCLMLFLTLMCRCLCSSWECFNSAVSACGVRHAGNVFIRPRSGLSRRCSTEVNGPRLILLLESKPTTSSRPWAAARCAIVAQKRFKSPEEKILNESEQIVFFQKRIKSVPVRKAPQVRKSDALCESQVCRTIRWKWELSWTAAASGWNYF